MLHERYSGHHQLRQVNSMCSAVSLLRNTEKAFRFQNFPVLHPQPRAIENKTQNQSSTFNHNPCSATRRSTCHKLHFTRKREGGKRRDKPTHKKPSKLKSRLEGNLLLATARAQQPGDPHIPPLTAANFPHPPPNPRTHRDVTFPRVGH